MLHPRSERRDCGSPASAFSVTFNPPGANMEVSINRRSVLGAGAALLVNASSVAPTSASPTHGKTVRHARSGALEQIDLVLARAIEKRKVTGIVAMGATESGLVS